MCRRNSGGGDTKNQFEPRMARVTSTTPSVSRGRNALKHFEGCCFFLQEDLQTSHGCSLQIASHKNMRVVFFRFEDHRAKNLYWDDGGVLEQEHRSVGFAKLRQI